MSMNYGNLKNINLPKLDRIIVKNSSPYKGSNHHHHGLHHQPSDKSNIDVSNMLKIEGKGDDSSGSTKSDGGRKTPIRKVSSEEINSRHLPLKRMVCKDELGTPSFYTPAETASPILARR